MLAAFDYRPTVGAGNLSCAELPPILSYHVHGGWDAKNVTQSRIAKATFEAFADALEAIEGICPFSHANASADFPDVW